jgi:hypothetical protein
MLAETDHSVPHDCVEVPEGERVTSGSGPGKRVVWEAGLGRMHYDEPGRFGIMGSDLMDMMEKVAAHVGFPGGGEALNAAVDAQFE